MATATSTSLAQSSTTSGTVASPSNGKDQNTIMYSAERIIGNGSFGVVFRATIAQTGEVVAIKKVLQDKRFKVRLFLSFAGSSLRIENCKLCGR